MKSFFQFFAERHLLVNAITVIIIMMGLYTVFKINLEEFPNAETNMVMISASYTGASPRDVELEVTNELEDALAEVSGIKTMSSTSAENSCSIMIEIDEDEDADEVYDDIVDAINGVNDLPDDADDPSIRRMDPKKKPILWLGFTSKQLEYRELRQYAHDFESKVLDLPGVASASLSGYLDREVRIAVSFDKMEKYGISMTQIKSAIANRNIRSSGGTLKSDTEQKNIITLAKFEDPLEVEDVIVKSYDSGALIRIKDIATVTDGFVEAATIQRFNGSPSIGLRITKKASADIIETVDQVEALMEAEIASLPEGMIDIMVTEDDSEGVENKFEIVKSNGLMGLIMVFIVLCLFLNVGTSFWVAMGIPISLLGTMIFLPMFDLELDSLTMAAMILVLGLIVDDAIVVAENIYQHRERGASPLDAAVNGLMEVALPVVTTVATTILAFLPMLFIQGMIGKFIFVIPLTVILALSFSLIESFLILPRHVIPSLSKGQKVAGRRWFEPVRRIFRKLISRLMGYRYLCIFTAFIVLAGLIFHAGSHMRFKLFDRGSNIENLSITLEMPIGTSLEVTAKKMLEVDTILQAFPATEISSYSSTAGSGGHRSVASGHLGTFTVYLPEASDLTRSAQEIMTDIRTQLGKIKGTKRLALGMSVKGPPTGEPVEIMVKGGDKEYSDAITSEIMTFLKGVDGVYGLDRDDKAGKDEINIVLDYPLLSRYGLTAADVATTVRTAYYGSTATTTRYADEDVDFTVILERSYRENLDYLKNLKIANTEGELINLGEVAKFNIQSALYAIYHEDGDATTTITGDIDETVITALEVMNLVEQEFNFEKMRNYPGVLLDIGGEAADSQQAQRDILVSFAFAAVGIYCLLMLLFNSLTQPLVVLATIPFGLGGVILGFLMHGIDTTSLFAAIGAIGLVGVVVNDALVMVDHINKLLTERPEASKAEVIAEGAANRLRPVILTTVTTVVGLLPLIYGIGGEDSMMGPMAMSLGYGLLFSSPVTLILLPCFYMVREDVKHINDRVKGRIKQMFNKNSVA
jgi:multidrug efflux pump subunit AcrB